MLLPGGLLDITEWDFGLYDENLVRITVDTDSLDAPYLPRFFAFVSEAVSAFRGDVRAADYMYDEVLAHEAFEEVTYRDFWLSSCPWTTNNPWQMTAVGAPMTEDILVRIFATFQTSARNNNPRRTTGFHGECQTPPAQQRSRH